MRSGFLWAVLAIGCQRAPADLATAHAAAPEPSPRTVATTAPVATEAAPPPKARPTLTADAPLARLPVEGFGDAIVSLPLGAHGKRPVVIAVHGNYDRPEWQCGTWRSIVRDRAFVLCPRGIARTDSPSADDIRFTFANGVAMRKELDAAIATLRARHPEFVDDGPMLYTGFSLGAITGVAYLLQSPSSTPRAVLTEGSHAQWTPAAVRAFAKQGGARVLFACGQPGCVGMASGVAKQMKSAGVDSRVVYGKGMGHAYDGAVADEIRATFDWLVEGDARWSDSD